MRLRVHNTRKCEVWYFDTIKSKIFTKPVILHQKYKVRTRWTYTVHISFAFPPYLIGFTRFVSMVPKLPLDIIVPQYALRRRGAICLSAIPFELYKVRLLFLFYTVFMLCWLFLNSNIYQVDCLVSNFWLTCLHCYAC